MGRVTTPELDVDFVFSDGERRQLFQSFNKLRIDPYTFYDDFIGELRDLAETKLKFGRFQDFCISKREVDQFDDPYVVLRNCPIDDYLPFLDPQSPVVCKRKKKTTYVAEAFLTFYAMLMKQQPIGYINVNDGDVFQDIHPKKGLYDTQSQKALSDIYFHKDLANHFVRPDWVNILGLRTSASNEIYTCFVRNKDLLEKLDDETLKLMREKIYYTPYDDLTVKDGSLELGEAPKHPILGGAESYDIRFFENRTIGLTEEAERVVATLIETLHKIKRPFMIQAGDLIGSANNECIHNKQVGRIYNNDAVLNRWLMKTVNVRNINEHKQHLVQGSSCVING